MAAGQVAVDAIGGAEHEPQGEGHPRAAIALGQPEGQRGDEDARHGDDVGPGGDGGGIDGASAHVGDQVRPRASTMRTRWNWPTARWSGTSMTPSISGATGVARRRLVDQHRDLADCSSRRRRVICTRSPATCQTLGRQRGIDLPIERRGVRAVLGAVGEEAAPVEVCRLTKRNNCRGRPRSRPGSRHEVAAEGRGGLTAADVGDPPQEAPTIPHRRIRRSSGLLTCCSEVEVGDAGVTEIASTSSSVRSLGYRRPRLGPVDVHSPGARAARSSRPGSPGRSLPQLARSWATRTDSTSSSSTSSRIASMSRLRCGPRKLGIAQNPQVRSHPRRSSM